jgi:hypothetical protein
MEHNQKSEVTVLLTGAAAEKQKHFEYMAACPHTFISAF